MSDVKVKETTVLEAPPSEETPAQVRGGHLKQYNFKAGKSGNPGGRPKIEKNIREMARAHTELAVQALIEVVKDKRHPQRVVAANSLLDRGYGKPLQQHEIGKPGAFADLSDQELDAIITAAAEELKQIPAKPA